MSFEFPGFATLTFATCYAWLKASSSSSTRTSRYKGWAAGGLHIFEWQNILRTEYTSIFEAPAASASACAAFAASCLQPTHVQSRTMGRQDIPQWKSRQRGLGSTTNSMWVCVSFVCREVERKEATTRIYVRRGWDVTVAFPPLVFCRFLGTLRTLRFLLYFFVFLFLLPFLFPVRVLLRASFSFFDVIGASK